MRRSPSIVALLVAAIAVAALSVLIAADLRRAVPERSPAKSIAAAAQQRADAREARASAEDRSWDVAFDPAMVKDRVVWRAQPGSPATTDATIVNATPGADLAESARACAEWLGPKTRVQCYAFASTEAYDYKNITAKLELAEPTAIVNLCWQAMASNAAAKAPITISDMRQAGNVWEAQGCPDSWRGRETKGSES